MPEKTFHFFGGELTSATTAVDDQSDDVCMYAGVDVHNRTKIGATRKGSGGGIKIKKR